MQSEAIDFVVKPYRVIPAENGGIIVSTDGRSHGIMGSVAAFTSPADFLAWMAVQYALVSLDATEIAYRNGFKDGEQHAGEAVDHAISLANTYRDRLDALANRKLVPSSGTPVHDSTPSSNGGDHAE